MIHLLFFVMCGGTLSLMLWAGMELLRPQEDPLGDRLEELQSHALVATARVPRRKATGTLLDRFLYLVSLAPGGEDWIRGSEKLLLQGGVRRKQGVGIYVLLTLTFLLILVLGVLKLQNFQIGTNLIGGF